MALLKCSLGTTWFATRARAPPPAAASTQSAASPTMADSARAVHDPATSLVNVCLLSLLHSLARCTSTHSCTYILVDSHGGDLIIYIYRLQPGAL